MLLMGAAKKDNVDYNLMRTCGKAGRGGGDALHICIPELLT